MRSRAGPFIIKGSAGRDRMIIAAASKGEHRGHVLALLQRLIGKIK